MRLSRSSSSGKSLECSSSPSLCQSSRWRCEVARRLVGDGAGRLEGEAAGCESLDLVSVFTLMGLPVVPVGRDPVGVPLGFLSCPWRLGLSAPCLPVLAAPLTRPFSGLFCLAPGPGQGSGPSLIRDSDSLSSRYTFPSTGMATTVRSCLQCS